MSPSHFLTNSACLALLLLLSAQIPAQPSAKTPSKIIVGKVLDQNGKPAIGATVHLVSRAYPGVPPSLCTMMPYRGPRFQVSTKTDDKGRFRVSQDNPHLVGIYAQLGKGKDQQMTPLLAPVSAGDYRILKLHKIAPVSGVVRDTVNEKPIAGAHVHAKLLADTAGGNSANFKFQIHVMTRSDGQGRYTLPVPAGSKLLVTAEWKGRYLIETVAEAGAEKDLGFDAGMVLEGIVQAPNGKPIQGALVQDAYQLCGECRTDADGKFRIVTNRGRYWIHVVTKEFVHAIDYTHQNLQGGLVIGFGGRLEKKKDSNKKGKKKLRTYRLKTRGGHLRARILGKDGKPLADAPVLLAGMPGRISNYSMTRLMAWPSKLDANGVLDIHCMDRSLASYAFVEVDGVLRPLFAGRIGRKKDLGDVTLPRECNLSGTVQMLNRMPAAHARLLLRRRPDGRPINLERSTVELPYQELLTDRAGRFRTVGLQAGTYELLVDVRGHFPYLSKLQITAETEPLKLRMPAGTVIAGTLTDADSVPVANAPVAIYHQNYQQSYAYRQFGFVSFQTMSDAKGRFRMQGIPEGSLFRVYCNFRKDGSAHRSINIQNVEPGTTDLDVVLTSTVQRAVQKAVSRRR